MPLVGYFLALLLVSDALSVVVSSDKGSQLLLQGATTMLYLLIF